MARGRTQFAIVVIGIFGFGVMGFMMKFALESNPSLVAQGRMKQALLERYSDRGIDEVSIRTLPQKRGHEVRVVVREAPGEEVGDLMRDIGKSFVAEYDGRKRYHVKVSLFQGRGWGCGGPQLVSEREFVIPQLTLEIRVEEGLKRIVDTRDEDTGLRIASARVLEGGSAVIEVVEDAWGPEATPPDQEQVDELFEVGRELVEKSLRGVPVRGVTLVLRSSRAPEIVLEEQTFEPRRVNRRRATTRRRALHTRPASRDSLPHHGNPGAGDAAD